MGPQRWTTSSEAETTREHGGRKQEKSDEHGGNPEGQMMALAGLAGEEVSPCQRRQLSRPRVAGLVDC